MLYVFQLADKYDIIMNCTGLGSNKLINDKVMVPSRGQMFRVRSIISLFSRYLYHVIYLSYPLLYFVTQQKLQSINDVPNLRDYESLENNKFEE